MLRIRLSRTGKKRQPSYRVVVAEKDSKRDGRVVERIGHYNPLPNPAQYQIDEARALHWLSVGAQPSDAVRILLQKQGTFDRLTRLHAGESLNALVSEFKGVEPMAVVVPAVAEATASATAETAAALSAIEAATLVAEQVEDEATESAAEVEEAIAAVLDADEEE